MVPTVTPINEVNIPSTDPEREYFEETYERVQKSVITDISSAMAITGDAELIILAASEGWDAGGKDGSAQQPYLITGYTFGSIQTYSGK